MAELDGLLDAACRDQGGALALRGEPGVGLTALLDYAVDGAAARGMVVSRTMCAESEQQLRFAGVHQLCARRLGGARRLPAPQREALDLAFGRVAGPAPEPFLVGLGVLALLSASEDGGPVLCAVDDAQWLDAASAAVLAFVSRRLIGEKMALLMVVQESAGAAPSLTGLPGVAVGGLSADPAGRLLQSVVASPLDTHVVARLVAETAGNPLALLELSAALTPDQLGGVARLPESMPVGDRTLERFLRHVRRLPADTQTLLLLAAVDPDIEPGVFWAAAARIGLSAGASAPAERERLVTVDQRIAFRHPLIRSAVYAAALKIDRLRVHRALADATDPRLNPERHAWHRALAAQSPDEEAAAELARSGDLAQARGDHAAALRLYERAARLSPEAPDRFARSVAAVEAGLAAGSPVRATGVLAELRTQALDEVQEAQVLRLRGAISFALGYGADAAAILLAAGGSLAGADPATARQVYLEALEASIYQGRLGSSGGPTGVAAATREAPRVAHPTPADALLDGLSLLLTKGHSAAAAQLRTAIAGLRREDGVRWLPLGALAAVELWDDEALHALATRNAQMVREAARIVYLMTELHEMAGLDDVVSGRFDTAAARFGQAHGVASAMGDFSRAPAGAGALIVAAWQGRSEMYQLAASVRRDAVARGLGRYITCTQYAAAVFENGLGNYGPALAAAREVDADGALYLAALVLPELIEAAVRLDEPAVAGEALRRLETRALASGTEWALGTLDRSRALLAAGADADSLYRSAIEHLKRSRAVPNLGRAHLLYGEWLRRARRRRDAQAQLRTAHEIFERVGASAFDERARVELLATGERLPSRPVDQTVPDLTAQEARIAQLVAGGGSNPQIAAQLYISPRTVEYHLHKIFRKLDVTSRTQLASLMRDAERR